MTAAVLVFAAGSAVGSGEPTIATVNAALSSGDRAAFVPLTTPVRVLDTRRPGEGPALGPKTTRSLTVTGVHGVPADASAIVMNVTVVLPTARGYLTAYPAGPTRPVVSSLNFSANQTIANHVTVKPGVGGQVSFFNSAGTSHVLADVAGYYVGHDHDDRYLPAASAQARTAPDALTCGAGQLLRAVAADGTPTCAVDVSGPAYEPGFGIAIDGTTISAEQGRSAAGAFTCPAGQYLRAVAADGAPTCNADQSGPTYTAGSGLTLTGTQFASAAGATVVPIRGDGTPEANGSALRSTITSLSGVATAAKPYVVVAAPGTYALGSSILAFPPHVSLVGSGRGQTMVTGTAAAASNGLIGLGEGGLLASLSVTNSTTGSLSTTAAVIVTGVSARIVDVAARATETTGSSYGIVVFSGGRAVVENSVASAHNTTSGFAYGIFVVSSATAMIRNTQISVTGAGSISGLETATSSTAEFVDGSVEAPVALKAATGTTMRVANSKVAGARSGTITCFGTYDASFAPVSC